MRQSKVSELIHNSSEYPDLAFAKVAVYFQNVIDLPDGGFEVIPGSEFVVAREARRDNSSKYWINKKVSNFGEVTTFLRARGIDLDHNRFLILQGEVEQIAMMKPKAPSPHEDGLLEYLEDIIGSNRLVTEIDAALKAMEELNEARATKLNAFKASQQQVQQLEGRRAEAEQFIATETQLNGKRCAYYQKNVSAAGEQVAEAEAKRDELTAKLKEEKEKAAGQREELAALEKTYKKKKKEHDRCAEQLDASRKEFQNFEREDIKHREELKAVKGQLKKAQANIEKETKKLGEARGELAAVKEDIPRLETEAAAISKTQATAQKELDGMYTELEKQTAPFRSQIDAAQKRRAPLVDALTAVQSEETLVAEEKGIFDRQVEEGAKEREESQAELDGHAASIQGSKDELKACEAEAKDITAKLAAAQKVVDSAEGKEKDLVAEESEARATYEAGRQATQGSSARSKLIDGLMAAKKSGKIPGIIGRLGSLATIDKQYDVAASTCCGALDHILVADTPAAQACVALLREQSLGVATFIILEKQAAQMGPKMEAAFAAPAGSQRLFDLLDIPKDEHRAAFYYAFRDTLVCDNKDKASKIALGGKVRHRVVTTDGIVINTSGTMEGGGKPMKGRLGPTASEKAEGGMSEAELAKALKKADAALEKLENMRRARDEAAESMQGLQKDAVKCATQQKKLKMLVESADKTRKALEERVKQAANAGALGKDELKQKAELEKQLTQIQKKVAAAQAKVDKEDGELAKLDEKVGAVGGVQLRATKSKVETLGDQLRGLEGKMAKAKSQAEVGDKSVAKMEAGVTKAKDLVTELEAKIESTKAGFKKLEDDAFEVMKRYEACQEELNTKEAELKEMQTHYDEFKSTVGKVRTVEAQIEAQIEDAGRAVKDCAAKLKQWRAKLDKLHESVKSAMEEAKAEAEAAEAKAKADAAATGLVTTEDEPAEEEAAAGGSGDDVLRELSAEELASLDASELASEISQIEEMLNNMQSDLGVIAEYKQRTREHRARTREFDAVTAERDERRQQYETLRQQRLDEFMGGFRIIGTKLKEMYQMITLGGDAELELLDSLDPFSEGIVFSVRPPKKSWKNIANLSGGEKTLSSLALVFALHHYKPTPLYVMDEIDAALDFRNVSIVGNYIKERTRNAQFVIISLRNNMFELADRLVGIYKTNNATKSVAIDPAAFTIAAR